MSAAQEERLQADSRAMVERYTAMLWALEKHEMQEAGTRSVVAAILVLADCVADMVSR